jgi:glyoxylase-like metal-dependent hydrolase (beta-lactamase superfamily II)
VSFVEPGRSPLRVGSIAITPIYDGTAILEPSMFTVPGSDGPQPTDWTHHQSHLNADGRMVVPVGGFLVRTGDRTVLMDAGVGDTHDDMFDGGAMLDSLRAEGVSPMDIDTIVISHLHTDHMGWLSHNEQSIFPNATIHIGAADWEHFVVNAAGGKRRQAHLRVVESQANLIDADEVTLAPGITTRLTPGHTPGHLSSVITSGTKRMIVLGDALHCPAQLTEPEWQFFYDVDRDQASRTRAQLLRLAEEPGTSLLPCHFPGMSSARLVRGNGTKTWTF